MHKKIIAILLVMSMIAMAGCSKSKTTSAQDGEESASADIVGEESTEETDEDAEESETFEVLEESIFDDEPGVVEDSTINEQENMDVNDKPDSTGTIIDNSKDPSGKPQGGSSSQQNGNGNQQGNFSNQQNGNGNKPGSTGSQQNSSGNQQGSSGGQQSSSGNQQGDSSTQQNSNGNKPGNNGGQQNNNGNKPGNTQGESSKGDVSNVDYEAFQAMSPSEQQAFMESFDSIQTFFEWYNKEKDKYEKENPPIEVNGGSIDLNEIVNGNR